MKTIYRLPIILLGLFVASLFVPEAYAGDEQFEPNISQGYFETLPAGEKLDILGGVIMTRKTDDETAVYVYILGLEADTVYVAHVLDQPCDLGEGGHYKISPTTFGTDINNEIWLAVRTNTQGVGEGSNQVMHHARLDTQSIVIHAPGGSRIACADFESVPRTCLAREDMAPSPSILTQKIVDKR